VGCLRNSQQNFGETSPDYALVTAIEGRALQSEGNEPVPWSGLQTELLERMPGKNVSAEPSTKDGIEAVRLCAFTPPGSSLDRHNVKVFPLTMNNASKFPLADNRCFLSFWFYGAPNQHPAQTLRNCCATGKTLIDWPISRL